MAVTRREFVHQAGLVAAAGLVGASCHPPCPTNVSGAMLGAAGGARCETSHRFQNWAKTIEFCPQRFCKPRTEEEVIAIVKDAIASRSRVRTQGAGHSFSQLLPTEGTLVSLDDLPRPIVVNGTRVTVPGGMRLKNLIPALRALTPALGLRNIGSITEQSIAGAFSTGTHGSGLGLGSLATQVVGVRLVDGKGEVHTITDSPAHQEDLAAARINLGALGIITEVTLECVPDYRVRYRASLTTFDEVVPRIDEVNEKNDRVVLWWLLPPGSPRDAVMLITKNDVRPGTRGAASPPPSGSGVRRGRLGKDRDRLRALATARPPATRSRDGRLEYETVGPYDEVLTIPLLPVLHRECEYAIPVENAGAALRGLRLIVEETDAALSLPVEVRFIAGDDALLSPTPTRPNGKGYCYIGASTLLNSSEVFERFEPLMKSLGGRPHWGKNQTVTQKEIAATMYPATYERFRGVRDRYDPEGVFANTFLEDLFPYSRS